MPAAYYIALMFLVPRPLDSLIKIIHYTNSKSAKAFISVVSIEKSPIIFFYYLFNIYEDKETLYDND